MFIKLLKPPTKTITNVKFVFFNILGRILKHNVSKRPSVKLNHYSLYDGPSGSCVHIKIRLKTSCLIGREPSFLCCSVKHATKSHIIVVMVTGY